MGQPEKPGCWGGCEQLGPRGGGLSCLAASSPRVQPVHLALSTHPLQAHVPGSAPLPREASAVPRAGAGEAGGLQGV